MALFHVNFFSEALDMNTSLYAVVPQKRPFAESGKFHVGTEKYRTLFLLHGRTDDHTIWLRRTSVERYAEEKGIAVIMPEVHLSYYSDMKHGLDYFTYVADELPAVARSFFPLSDRREDTYVAGLSMGGYGAVKVGLRRPESFSRIGAFSGSVDILYWMDLCRKNKSVMHLKLFGNSFGDPAAVAGTEDDLFHLVRRLKASGSRIPPVYQCCGTEDFLYQANVNFRDLCRKEGVDLTYEEWPGEHEWGFWDEAIRRFLAWLP